MLTMSDLALSTMWNYGFAKSGEELIASIAELGFRKAELNYHVPEAFLPGVLERMRALNFTVPSVHNVFPSTPDPRFGTDSVLLGYPDEALRAEAVRLTKTSVLWAEKLGARAVVVHPTEVPLAPDMYDRPMKQLIREGRADSEAFRDARARLLRARETKPYMDALMKSLDELNAFTRDLEREVYIGVENRSMCHQIPLYPEMEAIARRFSGSRVKLWFDTGHAIMMAEMGLQPYAFPERLIPEVIGVHIHDAALGRDHDAPYSTGGDILNTYLNVIRAAPVKTLELSGRLTGEEIRAGARRLIAQGNAEKG